MFTKEEQDFLLDAAREHYGYLSPELNGVEEAQIEALIEVLGKPLSIDMVLFCPRCGGQHIDYPDPDRQWENPPHRTHLCAVCEYQWRPSDLATNGVGQTQTHGSKDMDPVPLGAPLCRNCGVAMGRTRTTFKCPNCQKTTSELKKEALLDRRIVSKIIDALEMNCCINSDEHKKEVTSVLLQLEK